ncbi:hypothetical protein CCACVL1_08785 [Corchorus capsularis]|uniref:Uncharacterized protein n=1 Tax=Corchorus capsularis TaxID=210143 RepID=A0A1R3IYU8_COCAP|nr:hypothetical protein CCACVL1_08785 [Corchorus capsularis]
MAQSKPNMKNDAWTDIMQLLSTRRSSFNNNDDVQQC